MVTDLVVPATLAYDRGVATQFDSFFCL